MNYISGHDSQQIGFSSLADGVEEANVVRLIDAFVDKIDLCQLGFEVKVLKEEGRPPYDPKVLMKLYLYGYLNGVRSSRKLERECRCNVEVHWLLGKLQLWNNQASMEHRLHEPADAKESRRRDGVCDDDIQHETEFDDTRRERIDSLPQGVAAKLPESAVKLPKTP